MSEFTKAFGNRLKDLRSKRGLSQEQLANASGLHRTHISLIERDRRSIRLETLASLAAALGVEPAELLPTLKQGVRKK